MNFNFKLAIPHLIAIVVFALLSIIFFYPAIEGYQLKQDDIEHHKGMSHEIRKHKEDLGEEPLWLGNMFGGMPTYQTVKTQYSGNLIGLIHKIYIHTLPHPIGVLFASMMGFYILLMCLRINPWLGMLGAIAFAFSTYFLIILDAGHNTKANALTYIPPMIGGFILTLRGKRLLGFLLFSLFLALELHANHLQITFYSIFIVVAIGIAELITYIKNDALNDFIKNLGVVLFAVLLAVLSNIGSLLPTYEYSKYTTRGPSELSINPDGSKKLNETSGLDKDYITSWSYGVDETFTLIFPNAKGGGTGSPLGSEEVVEHLRKEKPEFFNTLVSEYQQFQHPLNSYWGNQPFVSGPIYAGSVIVFLALLCILLVRSRLVVALTICLVFTIMMSWGRNFMPLTDFLLEYLPLYNKFRAVSMTLVVAEFILPFLAIIFLSRLIFDKSFYKENKKYVHYAVGGFVLILAFIYITPGSFIDLTSETEEQMFNERINKGQQTLSVVEATRSQIIEYRESILRDDVLRALKYIVLSIVVLLLLIYNKIKSSVAILLLGALVLTDLWSINKEYVNNEKSSTINRSDGKYVNWIKEDKKSMPHLANVADKKILANELQNNSSLEQQINNKLNELQTNKRGRLDIREVEDIQYTLLMRNTHYRVLNTSVRLDQDSRTAYFHKNLGGYHAAKLKRYQEVIDFELRIERMQLQQAFNQGGVQYVQQLLPQMNIVNMMNTKYIIGIYNGKQEVVLNNNRLGNAWFVRNVKVVPNADSAILALENLNPSNQAVVIKADKEHYKAIESSYSPTQANISLTSYLPNELVYSYSTTNKAFAVFSEIFYDKGWNAYINGALVDHTRVNYILRGMEVPQGKGQIIFKFEPKSFVIGKYSTWISSLLFLIVIAGTIYTAKNNSHKLEKSSDN